MDLLLTQDPNFSRFWWNAGVDLRNQFVDCALKIESACPAQDISNSFVAARERLRRFFVTVQERQFQYTRMPRDWPVFILDEDKKTHLSESASRQLSQHLHITGLEGKARLYGG